MVTKQVVIVTPWFGRFGGGAESLARGMARELNRRGVPTTVLSTCSLSPYDDWWGDHWDAGVYEIEGVEVRRYRTNKDQLPYHAVVQKIQTGASLTEEDKDDFFRGSINSTDLVKALDEFLTDEYEILALPYFFGLTHSVVNTYPGKISLIPCFHDEPQFYWSPTQSLLTAAKRIFYNSPEEKEMTIRHYGRSVGRKIVEGVVTGVGVELPAPQTDSDATLIDLPPDYFVYAGRKERGKNVPLLCERFAKYVRQSADDPKLVFIGDGGNDLIPRTDEFLDLGFVPENTKHRVMAGANAMLTLSENESFSIVLMEGWLRGVPAVVSAKSPVMMGHVRRCGGGLYANDDGEFTAVLTYLKNEPAVARRLGQNGRNYVLQNFSFDAVLGRYLEGLLERRIHLTRQT